MARRGRKSKIVESRRHEIAALMASRDDTTTASDVAEMFGISRTSAYRAVRVQNALTGSMNKRLAELRKRKGPPTPIVIDGERFEVTPRAAEALSKAHAELAAGWRLLQDDRAEFEDLKSRTRVRVAKTAGPRVPVHFGFLRGPLRYSVTSFTYGPQPKVPVSTAASAPIELPPWPLPWEPMHPTEAVGQLFRRALRNQSLPAAATALDLVDKAIAALNAFRGVLTEPGTGPPIAEPAPEPVPEPKLEPQKIVAEKSAIFAKMFPELVKDQPPPGFGNPTNTD